MKKNDIYILAHEIKNPLSVIKGYLEMLDSSNVLKYKDIIKNELDRSIEILDSYMQTENISLNKEELDISILLNDIENNLKPFLMEKKVNLKINYIDDEIYVYADYGKLKQVFYNIIKNAVESHSQNIEISYFISSKKLKITIDNDGDRIGYKVLDKIGNNYTNKVLGHGIGTTLSKEIISLHNGTIKYQNSISGVSVIITLNLNGR